MTFWPSNPTGTRDFLALLAMALLVAAPSVAAAGPSLCMLPSLFPFAEDDERRSGLEARTAERFARAGIRLEGSAEVMKILKRVDERSGAVFDPATGQIDAAKHANYQDDIERSVVESLGCIGFVRLSLRRVIARYDGETAFWDGARIKINSTPRMLLQALAGYQEWGWVPALSLWIDVTDLQRRDVAFRSAGIEPIHDFSVSRGTDLLPEDQWLRDQARVDQALDRALGENLDYLKKDGLPTGVVPAADFEWP